MRRSIAPAQTICRLEFGTILIYAVHIIEAINAYTIDMTHYFAILGAPFDEGIYRSSEPIVYCSRLFVVFCMSVFSGHREFIHFCAQFL